MNFLDDARFALILLTALGGGLIGGLFFGFSTAVMPGLARRPPAEGMAAMQAINAVILNPLFLSVFMGTALGSLLLVITAVLRWHDPAAPLLLTGGMSYLVGSLGVTGVFNVPRNDALAAAAPTAPESPRLWADYLTTWTTWNHVRAAASLLAATALTLALCQ